MRSNQLKIKKIYKKRNNQNVKNIQKKNANRPILSIPIQKHTHTHKKGRKIKTLENREQ